MFSSFPHHQHLQSDALSAQCVDNFTDEKAMPLRCFAANVGGSMANGQSMVLG